MYLKDIMTTNVVTIPSTTNLADAKRIMDAHHVRRLPVVDRGELAGIISDHMINMATPHKGTTLSPWEFSYQLHAIKVKEIMEKNVVTVSSDMTAEEALAIAQEKKVGSLVVMDECHHVVGIATTNDFFYKIVNPVLGLGEPGTRVEVLGGGESKALEDIIITINKLNLSMTNLHIISLPDSKKKNLVIHLGNDNVEPLLDNLKAKKYKVSIRHR
ncbi:MAG: CBS domain-containing protein [Chloroflexota bacterium]